MYVPEDEERQRVPMLSAHARHQTPAPVSWEKRFFVRYRFCGQLSVVQPLVEPEVISR